MKAIKTALLALALPFFIENGTKAQQLWKPQSNLIETRWTKQVRPGSTLIEYPRPQLKRRNWRSLNGLWEYAITKKDANTPSVYEGKILVPFPVESSLSGVKRELNPDQNLWYKTFFKVKPKPLGRTILHFGAVDWKATILINGTEVGSHCGGYTAFEFDITDKIKTGNNELIVRVYDPTNKGIGPHGKQVLNPSNIYYTPSSGIWQTVWLETVPMNYIKGVNITPDVDKGLVRITVNSSSSEKVKIKIFDGNREIASISHDDIRKPIEISMKNPKLWSPDDPFLYDLEVALGKDKIRSYFGMRKVSVGKDENGIERIMLNNKPYYNLGTLDQGFWPDGLYTAPTDEALAFDIKAIKSMGFNTIRKHIKVEPARWYYHADKLGMLVWQDMVNPNQSLPEGSKQKFEDQNKEIVAQLYNHPSIITWVLFNERWGQYDQARLTKELKTMDSNRLVNGHSGEYLYVNKQLRSPSDAPYIGSDMTDVHSYPNPMISMKLPRKAQVLGEFGGIGVPIENHLWDDTKEGWGYDGIVTPQKMKIQYSQMIDSLVKLKEQGLSGSIYTQPFDVETEQNGMLTYDRELIKLSIQELRTIHAKLQPITRNYRRTTRDFSARVADTVFKSYEERLQEYQVGNLDSKSLRNLALLALSRKDLPNAKLMANKYILSLKEPITESNLNFILKFSSKDSGPGHKLIMSNLDKIGKISGADGARRFAQNVIFNTEVSGLLTDNPNWDAVDSVINKYPSLDSELIVGLSVIKYRNAVAKNHKNATRNLVNAATRYDDRFNGGTYNDWAWQLFENTNDIKELEKALEWSKKSLKIDSLNVNQIDTYANLLHKLGRTKEAIEWEKKAVKIDPNDQVFKSTLDKMNKGLETWPKLK